MMEKIDVKPMRITEPVWDPVAALPAAKSTTATSPYQRAEGSPSGELYTRRRTVELLINYFFPSNTREHSFGSGKTGILRGLHSVKLCWLRVSYLVRRFEAAGKRPRKCVQKRQSATPLSANLPHPQTNAKFVPV